MGLQLCDAARDAVPLAKETFQDFQRHRSQWLAAAIAYFTVFAIAPLIIIVVEIAGAFLGRHHDALAQLYAYLSRSAGPAAARGIRDIVEATFSQRRAGAIAQIAGWVLFAFGAVGLFSSLQAALNTVWDVPQQKRSWLDTVRARLLPFAAVVAIALLLLVSLAINTAMTALSAELDRIAPFLHAGLKIADFVASFGLAALLFALLFELLPERRIAWRDVWLGAAVSALLFVVGQFLLGWYLGRAAVSSTYGSFGGLVVFLLWVYYSAQILLLGAEFTQVYARRYGSLRS